MRILHWYPNFLGGGAVANSVLGLVNAQARIGAEVSIASAAVCGSALYGSVIDHLRPEVELTQWNPSWTLRQGGLTLRRLSAGIRNELVSLKPDLIHIHGEFNPDNLRVPTLFRCPIILTPHGAFHPAGLTKGKRALKKFYIAVAKYILYKKVVFHALTPMEEGHIRRMFPTAKMYCVPQGSSVQIEKLLLNENGCNKPSADGIRFLFVGRLDVYTKGLDLLLEAFGKVVQDLKSHKLTLLLVGPDWNNGSVRLEKQAEALGIDKCVTVVGNKTGQDLVQMFNESHIYIHVSRHEGHPLAVTEALLSGKPTILTDTIGTVSYREIFSLPHVIIVPPKVDRIAGAMVNAVKRFDDLQRSVARTKGIIREFFSWNRVAMLHLKAYDESC
jgi:glycosyltransferase involved in cell wall biosynthesis